MAHEINADLIVVLFVIRNQFAAAWRQLQEAQERIP